MHQQQKAKSVGLPFAAVLCHIIEYRKQHNL